MQDDSTNTSQQKMLMQQVKQVQQKETLQKRIKKLEDILLHNPKDFDKKRVNELSKLLKESPKYLDKLTRRVFDVNTGTILNQSESEKGMIGKLNGYSRKRREKKYFKKINNGFRVGKGEKIILAEGDSWFEFPGIGYRRFVFEFVKDIIDWLNKEENYAIFCFASAGDWLSNIISTKDYIENLPIHTPDVFLISGGGNDLVGDRLAIMLNSKENIVTEPKLDWFGQDITKDDEINEGRKYLSTDFYAFLNLVRVQYYILFTNIRSKPTYEKMRIITQGYDFVRPTNKIYWSFSFQPLLNYFTDHGKWLRQPFMLKGICDEDLQRKISKAMIHEFNEMMISIIKSENFENIHHIDCRGIVQKYGWHDEMHPKSKSFREIAKLYIKCIDSDDPEQVYTKDDL